MFLLLPTLSTRYKNISRNLFLLLALASGNSLSGESRVNEPGDTNFYKSHVYLTSSGNLQSQMRELAKLHPNYATLVLPPTQRKPGTVTPPPLKKRFKIIHIGDSHIQNDVLSDAIRQQFQYHFGNAGTGFLFPYSLAKSYGPRGISAQEIGNWIDYKTMTPSLNRGLGITGYGLSSYTPNAQIRLNFSDKFKQIPYRRLKVWHSVDSTSFEVNTYVSWQSPQERISEQAPKIYEEIISDTPSRSWGQSTFNLLNFSGSLESIIFEFSKTTQEQTHVDFYGFQLESENNSGVEYQSYGVVGSQFTHFINNANYAIEQLKHQQPNILVFSFGTNEAYNGKLVDVSYYVAVDKFLQAIQEALPHTAIVLTSCQDTRSNGKVPPKQESVNSILKEIAFQKNYAFFDLNAAMGGWNSIYRWNRQGLTLKDLVHFTGVGYTLQGKMIASALLEEYNQSAPLPIDIDALDREIDSFTSIFLKTRPIETSRENTTIDSSESPKITNIAQPKATPKIQNSPKTYKNTVHIVKSGESLYRIALRYNVTVEAIVKANKLKNPKSIKPGQKLLIPKK